MDKIEVTNGVVDPDHYGPIGDAARGIASYCDDPQRVHVYTAAFDAIKDILATRTDATPVARKQFPILGSRGAKIDLQLVEDHGKQVYSNHYQTVERLAERGGLSWRELHAVLNNRPWQKMDENTAIAECRAIEARYLGAFNPPATDVAALVEAAKAMLPTDPRLAGKLPDDAIAPLNVWGSELNALRQALAALKDRTHG